MKRVYNLIRPYVSEDPTFFNTVEEFDEGYSDLVDFCLKRTESIRSQLSVWVGVNVGRKDIR